MIYRFYDWSTGLDLYRGHRGQWPHALPTWPRCPFKKYTCRGQLGQRALLYLYLYIRAKSVREYKHYFKNGFFLLNLKTTMFCVRHFRHLPTKSAVKTAVGIVLAPVICERSSYVSLHTVHVHLRWGWSSWCETAVRSTSVCALGTCTMISRLPPVLTVVF